MARAISVSRLRHLILTLATEDEYGLYEIVVEVDATYPDVPVLERLQAARRAICDLAGEGLVQLRRRAAGVNNDFSAVPAGEVDLAVSIPETWDNGSYNELTIWFSATAAGHRAYEDGERRRHRCDIAISE